MEYIYSTDGKTNIGHIRHNLQQELIGADKQTRIAAGWYDYVSTVPELTDNQYAVCVGFIRNGDDFTGVYEVHDNEIEATEADKDAALTTLGVDMTEAVNA